MARLRTAAPILAALTLGLVAAWPLLVQSGFLLTRGGGDSPFLLLRLQQLVAGLSAGQFPVRWMPDADFGYGYPFFNYYAALPYYLAALLRLIGLSFVTALKLAQTGALALGALGMYAWMRSLPSGAARGRLPRPQALLAAAAYSYAPFHLANLYVRGDSLSELWAMAFYPLLLWRAQRLLDRPDLRRGLSLALVAGLLVLTHNISALNFMPFVALYLALGRLTWARPTRENFSRWVRPVLAGALALLAGLALAAFFWLPALGETGAVQLADVTQGYFFYGNHFRTAADLVQTTWFYSAETGPGLPTPFAMGLVQALLTALGLLALIARALDRRRWTAGDTFLLLGLALTTFMITPASEWVWAHVPLVRYTQFPWRFLSIQALFTAALTAHVAPPPRSPNLQRWLIAGAMAVALGVGGLGGLRPEFVPLRDEDVTPQRLQLLEYFSGNIGSTIGYEYLPRAVQPRPFASDVLLGREPRVMRLSGEADGARQWQRGASEAWTINVTSAAATVAVPTNDWPGWQVWVDGVETPAHAAEGLGWIAFDLGPGAHTVELRLGRTPLRAAAELLSALAWLGWLAGAVVVARRAGSFGIRRYWPWVLGLTLISAVGTVAYAAYVDFDLGQEFRNGDYPSIDFSQLTYYQGAEIHFADDISLYYNPYDNDHMARGDILNVSVFLGYNSPVGTQVTVSLVPGSNLLSQAPVMLVSASGTVTASVSGFQLDLPIPTNIPPGVYFVTVQAAGPDGPLKALTREGRERGLVYLAPVWIDDGGPVAPATPPLASFGAAIDLLTAAATTPEANVVQLNLAWHALATIPANHQIALRLRDAAGTLWAGQDMQLAYGMYPTSLWRTGEVVPDFYRLALPLGLPPGAYTLSVSLYDSVTLAPLGEYAVPVTIAAAAPRAGRAAQHTLTPDLALGAVTLPDAFDQGAAPEFSAAWLTTAAPSADYRARWTLIGADGARVTQVLDLAPGSPPTTWPADAFVLGRVRFGTNASLQPGAYTVAVQLVDAAEQPVGAEVSVGSLTVRGRARSYDVPAMETTIGAKFGDALTLYGFDAAQTPETLSLTLAWGALAAPGHDYKFFVHLFNPADSFVLAQVDGMPRDNAYPTALWVAGEVVTDTVSFALNGLPSGSYGLAVGWYDPAQPHLPRLPAVDAAGQPLPDDRLVLPYTVVIP